MRHSSRNLRCRRREECFRPPPWYGRVGLRPRLACSVDFASRWTLCKALVAFVCVYVEHITVGDLQMLVSYVSLYSTIIHSLKPFTSDLFRAFGGLTKQREEEARVAV